MGLIRKFTSVGTMGMVGFRSSKERTARYTRQTRNATRAMVAQEAMALELQRQQITAQMQHDAWMRSRPNPTPAGWYGDPQGQPGVLRWWDGAQWTIHTQLAMPPTPPQPVYQMPPQQQVQQQYPQQQLTQYPQHYS